MMIAKIFFLLFLTLNPTGFAGEMQSQQSHQPKLVLLTSLNLTSLKPVFFEERYRTYNLRLEKQFRDHFQGKNYRLEIFHFARQNEVWEALTSKDNAAVILVAHAGSGSEQIAGIERAALIDLYGYDMTPVLQGLHPDLKFLGVIGCNYKQNLERLVKTKLQTPNQNLSTSFFDKKD